MNVNNVHPSVTGLIHILYRNKAIFELLSPGFLYFPCYPFPQFSDATFMTDRCSAAGVADCASTSRFSQRPNSNCLDVVHELNCQIKKMSSGKASCPCGSERIWSVGHELRQENEN